MVAFHEAKGYLRVDSSFEDELISIMLQSAEAICMDVARLTLPEWKLIKKVSEETTGTVVIRGVERTVDEVLQMKELLRIGIFYTIGYLFEHRQEADHHSLVITLRNLFFSIREGVI